MEVECQLIHKCIYLIFFVCDIAEAIMSKFLNLNFFCNLDMYMGILIQIVIQIGKLIFPLYSNIFLYNVHIFRLHHVGIFGSS